jgi:tetratricopeptide (TPR) repeat protein
LQAAHIGDPAQAEALLREALAIYERLGDLEGAAGARVQLAFDVRDERKDAQELLAQAEAFARSRDDKQLLCRVWSARSGLAHRRSDWPEAERCRRLAYELAIETVARGEAAGLLDQIGGSMRMQGRYAEAEPVHERALELLLEIGDDRRTGVAFLNFAGLRKRTGRLDDAAKLYERALVHIRKCGDVRMLGHGLGNYADLLHKQARLEESAAAFVEALGLLERAGDRLVYAIQQGRYAALLKRMGRDTQARTEYRAALEALEAAGNLDDARITREEMQRVCAETNSAAEDFA